jgi:hypothetical protein
MGPMNRKTCWGAVLLAVSVAMTPGRACAEGPGTFGPDTLNTVPASFGFSTAQGYAPPENPTPFPLGSTRLEDGGLYLVNSIVLYRQTNPLKSQTVAVRGFQDVDGSISVAAFGLSPGNQPGVNIQAGNFFGSRAEALDVHQVTGPNLYVPGYDVHIGYKFADGSALEVAWMYLADHKTLASATAAPPGLNVGTTLADSFLFSPVFGFPPEYAGAPMKIAVGNPFAAYGIWNGATTENIDFVQRTQQYEMTYRYPIYETETYRASALVGPRFFWIWERFRWITNDLDTSGNQSPDFEAIYSNVVSNRMYGAHVGISQECYLGHGFAATLDLQAAVFLDSVKEEVKYELADKYSPPVSKRTQVDWAPVPELQANVGIAWYPVEAVQIQLGIDAMAFFNSIASQQPIDFNYGAVNPEFNHVFRLFDGFNASIGISF